MSDYIKVEEEVRNILSQLDSESRMKIIRSIEKDERRERLALSRKESETGLVFLANTMQGEWMLFEELKDAQDFGDVTIISKDNEPKDADLYLAINSNDEEDMFSSFEGAANWIAQGENWESTNCRGKFLITPEWVHKTYIWGTIHSIK